MSNPSGSGAPPHNHGYRGYPRQQQHYGGRGAPQMTYGGAPPGYGIPPGYMTSYGYPSPGPFYPVQHRGGRGYRPQYQNGPPGGQGHGAWAQPLAMSNSNSRSPNQQHQQRNSGYNPRPHSGRGSGGYTGPRQGAMPHPSEQKLTVVEGPVYSIDVECVASGPTHNEREVAHIAMVDINEQVVLNVYVKPEKPVFSYIEPLTGCNEELVSNGIPLAEAVERVKALLPKNAVLVGQNILKDVQWLGLSETKDFASMLDLAGLFRVYTPRYKNPVFHSLHHKAKALLGINQGQQPHTADKDAQMSVILFKLYLELEKHPDQMALAKQTLLDTPLDATFVKLNPAFEGACMGARKTCTCGAPFFY